MFRLLTLTVLLLTGACGKNVLVSGEAKDPAEDATVALENKNPNRAIDILESALQGQPDNPQLLSILALAYADRAGVEPLSFAAKMAANGGTTGDSSTGSTTSAAAAATGGLTSLFGVMPEANAANLSDIDKAVSILTTKITPAHRQPGDIFKLAIYETASMVLHIKALDTLGTGTLTTDEITNLSDAAATGLLSQLGTAKAALAANGGSDASSLQAAAAIAKYQDAINAEPGTTDADKLRNYLAANPGAAAQAAAAQSQASSATP